MRESLTRGSIRPPPRLTLLLLTCVLVGAVAVLWASGRHVNDNRQELVGRVQTDALAGLARRAARAMHFSMALADPRLIEEVGETLLAEEPHLKGLRISLTGGPVIELGAFDETTLHLAQTVHGEAGNADLLFLGDWPLRGDKQLNQTLGKVEVYSSDPAGVSGIATGRNFLLPSVLFGVVVVFLGIGLYIRHRVLKLCEASAAISRGDFGSVPKVRGADEIAWAGRALSEVGMLLAEQVDKVHGRNAALLRDVTIKEDRLQRIATFAASLVAPISEHSMTQPSLRTLVEETHASVGLLFAIVPGTPGKLVCDATIGLQDADPSDPRIVAGLEATKFERQPDSDEIVQLAPLPIEHPWMRLGARKIPLDGVAALPVRFRGGLEGIVILGNRTAWSEMDLTFMADAARPLAIAMANRRAYEGTLALSQALQTRNEELAKQRDKLKIVDRMRTQFVANMSHELRTPLNAIVGYTELLADGCYGPVDEKQEETLERVLTAAHHLLQLVNQVLDLSRAEAGELSFEIGTCNLRRVADEVVSIAEPLCRERPYKPKVVGPEIIVETDGERIHQIITNLVANAIKFTDEGSVTVQLEPRAKGGAEITVIDTGVGVDQSHIELIFEEFRQADASSTRAHDGVGLGLAISRRLANGLGGALSATSTVGKGSRFTLTLPRRAPQALVEEDNEHNADGDAAPVGVLPEQELRQAS